ncbi:MAG: YabP/YqfC family sporulation protein [Clostridia bacterium]|nr:YabP/YqfC family sporulation protein [Clostridia bacterium]
MLKKVKHQLEVISPLETSELLYPHIDLCSNKEVYIDGCMGIIEYNSSLVRINCKGMIVKISGDELSIKSDSAEQISISGNIISLDFTGA